MLQLNLDFFDVNLFLSLLNHYFSPCIILWSDYYKTLEKEREREREGSGTFILYLLTLWDIMFEYRNYRNIGLFKPSLKFLARYLRM